MRSTWKPAAATDYRRHSSTACTLTRDRIHAMADGVRAIAALPDPVGEVIADLDAAERPASSSACARRSASSASSSRAGRMSLPTPARYASRPAMPSILRGGSDSRHSTRGDPRLPRRRTCRGRIAGGSDPDRADHRPRRRRRDARGPERQSRRHRAARRQGAGRACPDRRRGCRSSPISKASATSMSM